MHRNLRPSLLVAVLLLFTASPLVALGIVLEVPIPKANVGGAAASGGSLTQLGRTLSASGQNLGAMYLGGNALPAVENVAVVEEGERAIRQAQNAKQGVGAPVSAEDEETLLKAEREIRTQPAPKVGSEGFQKELENVREGTREIGAVSGDKDGGARGSEKSAELGTRIFDNGGLRESRDGEPAANSDGGTQSRGFQGRRSGYGGDSFTLSLRKYGVPMPQIRGLYGILQKGHPGKQDEIYHNREHSERVADTMAAILSNAPPGILNTQEKALLLVAAALHDVDPQRKPGIPARVAATLEYLDSDPEIGALLSALGLNSERGRGQLKTLIKFTDFDMDPAKLEQIKRDAASMAQTHFGPLAGRWTEFGRLLAFADQTAMYHGTVKFAKQAVDGLAHEIRTVTNSDAPSNAVIQAGTSKFLAAHLANPFFALLPMDMQANFLEVYQHYVRLAGPQAPLTTRAPPENPTETLGKSFKTALNPFKNGGDTVRDAIRKTQLQDKTEKAAQAFLRYERSLAGGIKLSPKQHRDMFTLWLRDESGVKPDSELGLALLARFFPQEAAAQGAALSEVSPKYARMAALIVELGGKMGVETRRVEALIAKDGELDRLLTSSRDASLARRVLVQILQRDRVERLVAGYPNNAQGDFLRSLGSDILAPSGKSIEEITRSGAFAYVNFFGNSVRDAKTGRDPDNQSSDQVFYVTLEPDGRWTIGGYRKNMKRAGTDAEYVGIFKKWLVAGGVPESSFSPTR